MAKKISLEDYNAAFQAALDALKKGKLVIFPTDTVYGIGANATDEKALKKIYAAKGREDGKPLAVVMSGLGMIREWCETSGGERILMETLPGPYTFILKLKNGKKLAGQSEKIGIRIPNHFFLRRLVLEFGKPIAATSANESGGKDPTRIGEVPPSILRAAAIAIDGGKTEHGKPSTVVDLVEQKILRKGAGEFQFK